MELKMAEEKKTSTPKRGRIELKILLANLILIGIVVVYFLATRTGTESVKELTQTDPQSSQKIRDLELALQRDPSNIELTLELARLYSEAGEFPWSYDALREVEKRGGGAVEWRIRLALAYLDLGKNEDARRVLKDAKERCQKESCSANLEVKLGIFQRLTQIMIDRHLDSRRQRGETEKALREIVKPVKVDPSKLRPKAPASLPSEPKK
jgi:thioredoxin-like negative regulator of GroEL